MRGRGGLRGGDLNVIQVAFPNVRQQAWPGMQTIFESGSHGLQVRRCPCLRAQAPMAGVRIEGEVEIGVVERVHKSDCNQNFENSGEAARNLLSARQQGVHSDFLAHAPSPRPRGRVRGIPPAWTRAGSKDKIGECTRSKFSRRSSPGLFVDVYQLCLALH